MSRSERFTCPLILRLHMERGSRSSLSTCALTLHSCQAGRKLPALIQVSLALGRLMSRSLGAWELWEVGWSTMRIWLRVKVVLRRGRLKWSTNVRLLDSGCVTRGSALSYLSIYEKISSWGSHKGRREICIYSSRSPNWEGLSCRGEKRRGT